MQLWYSLYTPHDSCVLLGNVKSHKKRATLIFTIQSDLALFGRLGGEKPRKVRKRKVWGYVYITPRKVWGYVYKTPRKLRQFLLQNQMWPKKVQRPTENAEDKLWKVSLQLHRRYQRVSTYQTCIFLKSSWKLSALCSFKIPYFLLIDLNFLIFNHNSWG